MARSTMRTYCADYAEYPALTTYRTLIEQSLAITSASLQPFGRYSTAFRLNLLCGLFVVLYRYIPYEAL